MLTGSVSSISSRVSRFLFKFDPLERHPHIFIVVTFVCIARLLPNTTMWFLIRIRDSY